MPATEEQLSVSLPEGLGRQFAGLRKRLWNIETSLAVCLVLASILASLLLLFISDRFWDTPGWLRFVLSGSAAGLFIFVSLHWATRWLNHAPDLRDLARLVQGKYRRLGDRLLGIVELSDEAARPVHFSPALYRAAIHQVSVEAAEFDFQEAVSTHRVRKVVLAMGCLLVLAVLIALLLPQAAGNALLRWSLPLSSIPRYTLVSVELPTEQIVPQGEAFAIRGTAKYHAFWNPTKVRLRFENQAPIEATVKEGAFRAQIPGQIQKGILNVRLGDMRKEIRIAPTLRPSLLAMSASIQLPDYLRYPSLDQKVQSGSLGILEGSRVGFKGQVSRDLASGEVKAGETLSSPFRVRNAEFNTDPLALDQIAQCVFTWRDSLGLSNGAPWRLLIQNLKDLPPVPELADLPHDLAILESEVVPLTVRAQDDFGVLELGFRWNTLGDGGPTNGNPGLEFKAATPTSQEKKFEKTFHFNPGILRIPADTTLEVRAWATDYYPGREPASSPIYRISVVGTEKHAEMIRQRLESLMNRLEEVTRAEEKVANETRELKALSSDKLGKEEATQQLENAKEEQAQTAVNLEQMAKEGLRTMREALRNPTLSPEMLREWSKNLEQMQEISSQQMQKAASSLKAAQQSPNPSSRSEELESALSKEEEALQSLESMQKQVNRGIDQLQAWTLSQRLRKVGLEQKRIEGQLGKNVSETIGLLPNELPRRFQEANEKLAQQQSRAQNDAEILQGEIGRFFERTQRENYGAVSKEMKEARTAEELERVRGLITDNITMEAAQNLGTWSERFTEWAKKLEPKKQESDSGESNGGESDPQSKQLLEQLMALLRMREGEVNLREQTRVVEERKAQEQFYREASERLLANQRQLMIDLHAVQRENSLKELETPLREGNDAMEEANSLLAKPQTDEATLGRETRAIESISDAINLVLENAQQGNGSQGSGDNDMAIMMQMMSQEISQGVGMSPTGGGSLAGGDTERPATPTPGDTDGRTGETRTVRKSSGQTLAVPAEFRDALQHYYNALEQEKQ